MFVAPKISDNPTGWGPTETPARFKDIPYTPFGKGDRLGRVADWTAFHTGRQQYNQTRFQNADTVFKYTHDSEESFKTVDNRPVVKPKVYGAGAGARRGGFGGPAPTWQTGGRDAPSTGRDGWRRDGQKGGKDGWRGGQGGNRLGYRQKRMLGSRADEANMRHREPSVPVRPSWGEPTLVIDFPQLQKLHKDPVSAEDLMWCGQLQTYSKKFDRIAQKTAPRLEVSDTVVPECTTMDDPNIRQFALDGVGNVFVTDSIMAQLMCCSRSVNSWDVVVHKVGDVLFFDRRDTMENIVLVDETAQDPPEETPEQDNSINSLVSLGREARAINHRFSQQILDKSVDARDYGRNPFVGAAQKPASRAYRYRRWDLTEGMSVVCRTEIDCLIPAGEKGAEPSMACAFALNEFQTKPSSNWRRVIDLKPSSVLTAEVKNNSNKISQWTMRTMLAGADFLKMGFVSRKDFKNPFQHQIVSTMTLEPQAFAAQIKLDVGNMWGTFTALVDQCQRLKDGKYLMLKDPMKPALRIYAVADKTFEIGDEDEDA